MTIDYAKAKRWMTKELKLLREHLDRLGSQGFPEESRARIATYVAGTAPVGAATVGLASLSGWHGGVGCRRVLDGDEGGWEEIDRAGLYLFSTVRILACAYDADTRPQKGPRTNLDGAASAFTHAEAIGAAAMRDWLAERFRRIDAGDGSLGGKDMNPLVALVAHLATGKDPAALKASGWAGIGPYGSIAADALRPEDYEELADYHTRRAAGPGFPAFDLYPYRLVPFEILAIERRTGVRIETPKHPLLASPLLRARNVGDPPIPAELQQVIDRARSEFPV
jgi:hypothetical protein